MNSRRKMATALIAPALLLAAMGLFGYLDWLRSSRDGETAADIAEEWPGVPLPSLTLEPRPLADGPFNLIVLGLGEKASGSTRATVCDTIMVVHVDEKLKRTAVLSIPGNTYVEIQGYGRRTLDEAYGLGGIPLLEQVVGDITGMPVRNHLALRQEQFAWLVDLVGGVEFTLQDGVSDPRWGTLEAGAVLLDGTGALLVTASSGYPGGELARMRARQAFLLAAANQVHRAAGQPGFAWLLNLAVGGLETDLGADTVIGLAREFGSWPVVDISAGIAPGSSGSIGGRSVFLLDQARMEDTVRSIEASATVPN